MPSLSPARFASVSFALAVLGASGVAEGAGFYIADVGTRGMARGGAFVAAPDSPLAVHYNPSGLSLLKGFHLEVSVAISQVSARFERSCPCLDPEFDLEDPAAVEARLESLFDANPATTGTPLTIPFVGVAYGFEPLDLTIALAAYGPTSGRFDYGLLGPATAPGFPERAETRVTRYNAVEAPNLEINYALSFGLEPLKSLGVEGLRVGATLFLHQTGASQTLHLFADSTVFAQNGPEDPAADIPLVLDFLSDPSFSWGLGVGWDLPWVPGLTVGASFRAARAVEANGTVQVDLPTNLRDIASVSGEDVRVKLNIASIARVGVQYRRPGWFTAEAAIVFEGWGATDRVVIEPQGIVFESPILPEPLVLGTIVSERNWRDTGSLRLGGELELWEPWLGIQAGYFHEPSAVPTEWLEPSRIDLDKHGLALGLSASYAGFTLQIAGTYIAMNETTVTDSNARNTAPLGFAPELRTTVGNGTYSGHYLIGTASLGFALDELIDHGDRATE